jgi:hypothetical protein
MPTRAYAATDPTTPLAPFSIERRDVLDHVIAQSSSATMTPVTSPDA